MSHSTRIVQPKRHLSRAWEFTPYWQKVLANQPERGPSFIADELTDEYWANIPDSLKMPTTRAGWNAMRWKSLVKQRVKTVHYEKFHRDMFSRIRSRSTRNPHTVSSC